jgi:hypothetical protein
MRAGGAAGADQSGDCACAPHRATARPPPSGGQTYHTRVKALAVQGLSKSAIACRLGISRTSVRRLLG